ncbi:MAG: single-stranded DNA-binding protein [Bdellovibrionia bacterium]
MSGVNKVIIVGHLGADPELKFTASGQAVARFNVATSENWTDKQGQKQERTEWHRMVVWGKLGEVCGKHLAKGRQVYVEGRLQTRQWEDQQGQKRYTTEVVAQTVQFLGPAKGAGMSQEREPSQAQSQGQSQEFDQEPAFEAGNDEIPF